MYRKAKRKITYRKGNYKYQLSLSSSQMCNVVRGGDVYHCHVLGFKTPKVAAKFFFIMPDGNRSVLFIKDGYCWDGPSGPTFDTKDSLRASLYHDVLWQIISMDLLPAEPYRALSNEELHRVFIEDALAVRKNPGRIRKAWVTLRANYWKKSLEIVGDRWVKVFGTKKRLFEAP